MMMMMMMVMTGNQNELQFTIQTQSSHKKFQWILCDDLSSKLERSLNILVIELSTFCHFQGTKHTNIVELAEFN